MAWFHKLLRRMQADERVLLWKDSVWSDQNSDLIRYVLQRSRGLFFRKLQRATTEVCELIAFAMIASMEFAFVALALTFLGAMVSSVSEGAALIDRQMYLQGRRPVFGDQGVKVWSLIVMLVLYCFFYFKLKQVMDSPWLLRLWIVKMGMVTAELFVSAHLHPLLMRKRIYFPRWISFSLMLLSILAIPAFANLTNAPAFYSILIFFAGLRVFPTLYIFWVSRSINRVQTDRLHFLPFRGSFRTQLGWVILFGLMYAPLSIATFLSIDETIPRSVFAAWAGVRLMNLFAGRAFRAFNVDVFWFRRKHADDKVKRLAKFSLHWMVVMYGLVLVPIFLGMKSHWVSTSFFWITLTLLQGAILLVCELLLVFGKDAFLQNDLKSGFFQKECILQIKLTSGLSP